MSDRVAVLLAAGGEAWEAAALRLLEWRPDLVLKRCVDLRDLLASAATGQADVAVVAGDLPGLDADAVMQLLRDDVRCVAVGGDDERLTRIGVVGVVPEDDLTALPEVVGSRRDPRAGRGSRARRPEPVRRARRARRVGSSPYTVPPAPRVVRRSRSVSPPSTPIAANRPCSSTPTRTAVRSPSTSACSTRSPGCSPPRGWSTRAPSTPRPSPDADGWSADGLEVLTGLPRPDRWVEARPGVLDAVLDRAREVGDVVVDTGFSLEDDADLGRNTRPATS